MSQGPAYLIGDSGRHRRVPRRGEMKKIAHPREASRLVNILSLLPPPASIHSCRVSPAHHVWNLRVPPVRYALPRHPPNPGRSMGIWVLSQR